MRTFAGPLLVGLILRSRAAHAIAYRSPSQRSWCCHDAFIRWGLPLDIDSPWAVTPKCAHSPASTASCRQLTPGPDRAPARGRPTSRPAFDAPPAPPAARNARCRRLGRRRRPAAALRRRRPRPAAAPAGARSAALAPAALGRRPRHRRPAAAVPPAESGMLHSHAKPVWRTEQHCWGCDNTKALGIPPRILWLKGAPHQ